MSYLRLCVMGGLCSRLRAVVSAIGFCETTNRELVLHWPKREHRLIDLDCKFEAMFSDIWQLPSNVVETSAWEKFSKAALEIDAVGDLEIFTCHPEDFQPQFFSESLGHYANSLVPSEETQKRIDSVTIPEGCIGIHIRHKIAQPEAEPVEWYLERLQVEDVPLFLSADSKDVEDQILTAFPDTLVQDKPYIYNRDGIIRSAADLYLLSQCSRIVGSFRSSYSQMAAWMQCNAPSPDAWMPNGKDFRLPENWPQGENYEDSRNVKTD